MQRLIKIILSLFSTVALLAILVPVVLSILLSSNTVQNLAADHVAKILSRRAGTTITVDRINIRLFNRVVMEGLYVEDFNGDTLLYVDNLNAGFRGYNFPTRTIRVGDVKIDGARLSIVQDSTLKSNLSQVFAKFKKEREKKGRGFRLRASRLQVSDTEFSLKKYVIPEKSYGVNFSDLDVTGVNMDMQAVSIINDSINAVIEGISFREKSGFVCNNLSARKATVSSTCISLEELLLRDIYSNIKAPYFSFNYDNWPAYNDFLREVTISSRLEGSRVDLRTLAYFVPLFKDKQIVLNVTGTVEGPVADIQLDMDNVATGNSRMAFVGHIAGLPDISNTRFVVDIPFLETETEDITSIYEGATGAIAGNLQRYLPRFGNISFEGSFDGSFRDFTARGNLSSVPGDIGFDLAVTPLDGDKTAINGEVSLSNYDIGGLFAVKNMGDVTFAGEIDGFAGKDTVAVFADGLISSFRYNGYEYNDINIKGEVGDRYYKGYIGSDDPNIDFDLEGTFDLSGTLPHYDFDVSLANADLNALGFNKRDSVSLVSGRFVGNAEGKELKDIKVEGHISDLLYRFNNDTLESKQMSLFADNVSENKRAGFYSDFADVEIRSKLNFYDLLSYFRATIHKYIPSIAVDEAQMESLNSRLNLQANSPDNYYIVTGNIKQTNKLAAAITSGIDISEGTQLAFMFNPAENNFSLRLNSEYMQLKNFYFVDLNVTGLTQNDSLSLFVSTSEMEAAGFYLQDFSLIGRVENNRAYTGIGFDNRANGVSTLLNTTSIFTPDSLSGSPRIDTRFSSSVINFEDQTWRVSSPRITVIPSTKTVDVESFRVYRSDQGLTVSGRISPDPLDTLYIGLNNFDMRMLSGLVEKQGYELGGRMSGDASITGISGDNVFFSTINMEDVSVNGRSVRNSVFNARWDDVEKRVAVMLRTDQGTPVVYGGYYPGEKRYSLNVEIPDIDLALLQPFLDGSLRDVGGSADSHITLTSVNGRPSLNGLFNVKEFFGTVDFTNVKYNVAPNTVMTVDNSNFTIRNAKIYDGLGGEAEAEEFSLRSTYLKDFHFDINITPRNILALNTTVDDNDLFYGRAFASGSVRISGGRKKVNMNITARTENNSTFFMPIASSVSMVDADFITYRSAERAVDSVSIKRQIMLSKFRERRDVSNIRSDIDIRLDVNVLPNTEARIDPAERNTLRGNGTGMLSMHIKPREDLFTIIGDYRINEGSYEFMSSYFPTDKRFSIERGSYIQWTGDPLDAYINITAVYRIRTSIAPLVGGANNRFSQNVPVNCKVILTDMLLQPTISFDVEVPTADAEIQSIVRNAMSTQEMKSTQFLYLLATNRFYAESVAGGTSNIGTAATVSTGIEFLTNQISSLVSTDRYKFNFGYRPRSEMSSDEIDFSFEQELIPDRLIIEGEANYNLRNNPNASVFRDNHLTGDFYITYIIDRMGNLRTSAFTRTVDRFDENQGLQEHGIGIYYSRDFNTIRELFRRRRALGSGLPAADPEDNGDMMN